MISYSLIVGVQSMTWGEVSQIFLDHAGHLPELASLLLRVGDLFETGLYVLPLVLDTV
jgi:hypothetical protein